MPWPCHSSGQSMLSDLQPSLHPWPIGFSLLSQSSLLIPGLVWVVPSHPKITPIGYENLSIEFAPIFNVPSPGLPQHCAPAQSQIVSLGGIQTIHGDRRTIAGQSSKPASPEQSVSVGTVWGPTGGSAFSHELTALGPQASKGADSTQLLPAQHWACSHW